MYSESQFPLVCKIRVSFLRSAMRKQRDVMPHIPDDIYLHILGIFEAEFEKEKSKPLIPIVDAISERRSNLKKCIEYDLPYLEYLGTKEWYNRQYGLPNKVSDRNIIWIKPNDEIIIIDISNKTISYIMQNETPKIFRIEQLPPFQIDF